MIDVVVTGGAGFVGRNLIELLQRNGLTTASIDSQWPHLSTSYDASKHFKIDVRDRERLSAAMRKLEPRSVVHLAGIADARVALNCPAETLDIGVVGTANVLDAAREISCEHVIIQSSVWVYDAIVDCSNHYPSLQLNSLEHVYTAAMVMKEMTAGLWASQYGVPCTTLRPAPMYGPGMWDGLALASFVRDALAGQPLRINGDGSARRRFLHVRDLASAILRLLTSGHRGPCYDVSGPREVTVRELANLVCQEIPGATATFTADAARVTEYKGVSPDNQIISQDLGWYPSIAIEEGVAELIRNSLSKAEAHEH